MEGSTTLEHGDPGPDAVPAYVRDRGARAAIEERAMRALQPVRSAGASVALFEGEPPFAVAPMPELSTAGKLGLAVAWAHARSSPLQADPYDGTAFVVAKAIRDAGRDLTHLVLGLPGEAAGPRTVLGRIDELAAFAYELRRATGLEPRGLVIRGGVAPMTRLLGGRRDDERDALGLAWDKVGSGLPLLYSRYGLPLEELLVDLGAPADAITTHLVATATAMAPGWDPAVSVEAPAAALARVRRGSIAIGETPAMKVRLVSVSEPWVSGLPRVGVAAAKLPRRIRLRIERRVAPSRLELREITQELS